MTQSFLLYSIFCAIIDLVILLLVDMWAFYSFLFSVLKHVNVNNIAYVSKRTGTKFFSESFLSEKYADFQLITY